jgi:tripartite-type tricarboxylate transporter receptor subunit TctC
MKVIGVVVGASLSSCDTPVIVMSGDGCNRAHDGRANEKLTWSTHHCGGRDGAAGTIAVGRAVRAAPDGYTLSLGNNGSHVVAGATYVLRYDLLKDLEPVALLVSNPELVVAKKALPANDLMGLIARLKANPDKATQGGSGIGGITHVAGAFFQRETATRFQFVPYRGAAPAVQDLVAGQIDMVISDPIAALPQVRAGTIKAYGVTTRPGCSPRLT